MRSLGRHTEGLPDVSPGPALREGAIDGRPLKRVGEPTQGHDSGERLGWVVGGRNAYLICHASTLVDTRGDINQS